MISTDFAVFAPDETLCDLAERIKANDGWVKVEFFTPVFGKPGLVISAEAPKESRNDLPIPKSTYTEDH